MRVTVNITFESPADFEASTINLNGTLGDDFFEEEVINEPISPTIIDDQTVVDVIDSPIQEQTISNTPDLKEEIHISVPKTDDPVLSKKEERSCLNCGESFIPSTANHIYHVKACKYAYAKKKRELEATMSLGKKKKTTVKKKKYIPVPKIKTPKTYLDRAYDPKNIDNKIYAKLGTEALERSKRIIDKYGVKRINIDPS